MEITNDNGLSIFRILLVLLAFLGGCRPQQEPAAMNKQLIASAQRGDVVDILVQLSAGADINAQDARGRTAVMAATHANQPRAVEALIKAGADINLRDTIKDNVLLYAGAEGLLDILRLAIAAGDDPAAAVRGVDEAMARAKVVHAA